MAHKFLSSSSLKLLAITIMLIDHIGASDVYMLFPQGNHNNTMLIFRIIGRLAFPIFAFLIAEGYFYTRNVYKYIIRLFIFALISEIPFDLAFSNTFFDITHQNVFFTLVLGLLAIYLFEKYRNQDNLLCFLWVFLLGLVADLFYTDYGLSGVFMIFSFYYFRGNFLKISVSVILINLYMISGYLNDFFKGNIPFNITNYIELFSILSLIFIYFYNHKKGYNLKYLFYLFYPVHLFLLYLIRIYFVK